MPRRASRARPLTLAAAVGRDPLDALLDDVAGPRRSVLGVTVTAGAMKVRLGRRTEADARSGRSSAQVLLVGSAR